MKNQLIADVPKLLNLWDSDKNSSLFLATATTDNPALAWWVGECGHHWEREIVAQAQRAQRRRKNPCPFCSNERVLAGFNDVCSKNVGLYSHNLVDHDIFRIHYKSHKIYKWKCSNKHTYYASPAYHSMNLRCPWCAIVVTLFFAVTILVFGGSFLVDFLF